MNSWHRILVTAILASGFVSPAEASSVGRFCKRALAFTGFIEWTTDKATIFAPQLVEKIKAHPIDDNQILTLWMTPARALFVTGTKVYDLKITKLKNFGRSTKVSVFMRDEWVPALDWTLFRKHSVWTIKHRELDDKAQGLLRMLDASQSSDAPHPGWSTAFEDHIPIDFALTSNVIASWSAQPLAPSRNRALRLTISIIFAFYASEAARDHAQNSSLEAIKQRMQQMTSGNHNWGFTDDVLLSAAFFKATPREKRQLLEHFTRLPTWNSTVWARTQSLLADEDVYVRLYAIHAIRIQKSWPKSFVDEIRKSDEIDPGIVKELEGHLSQGFSQITP